MVDVPLQNRLYTWSSKRSEPSFSRLDRIFITLHFITKFPDISLKALEMIVSDHSPLLLFCKNLVPRQKQRRIEMFWLSNAEARAIISKVWSTQTNKDHCFQFFSNMSKDMHKQLAGWHSVKKQDCLLANNHVF